MFFSVALLFIGILLMYVLWILRSLRVSILSIESTDQIVENAVLEASFWCLVPGGIGAIWYGISGANIGIFAGLVVAFIVTALDGKA